jgi:hypothetical protein
MTTLVLWEADNSLSPRDPEERMKHVVSMLEAVKKSVDKGQMKMWGMSPGGGYGYCIMEQSGNELFAQLAPYYPYVQFKIKPMISVDEVLGTLKAMQP